MQASTVAPANNAVTQVCRRQAPRQASAAGTDRTVASFIDGGRVLCVASYARNTAPVLTAKDRKAKNALLSLAITPQPPQGGLGAEPMNITRHYAHIFQITLCPISRATLRITVRNVC
ncbi:MAG: hypothetical protein ACC707_19700 [Thiohalomonadales bacterium]